MMQIVYFSRKEDLLGHLSTLEGEKLYVTPSPAKADGLRGRLGTSGSQDVITIAKFTANLVELLWTGSGRPLVKRKSELLLIFGILKEKYLPDLGYEQFTQAYNLFSDLRSFTLDQDALSTVLDEQPEQIRDAVHLFWRLLDATGYSDEHGAYQQITERLRHHDELEPLKKRYIFWGFQHLNGQQVDLLKALAIRYDVIVPFPLEMREKLKKSDWPSWLKDHRTTELTFEAETRQANASWISTNSRELAKALAPLLKDDDQVILGVSKLSASHIDLVPSQKVMFKIPHQILNSELLEISETIKTFSGSHRELLKLCQGHLKDFSSPKHFRSWQLYAEALESISELTDESIKVDSFFLKVLSDVVQLNQPRTSFVPVSSEKATIDLKDMSSLEHIDRKRRVILCIDERFDEILSLGQNYTESIQGALAALGPLKRNELELLFRQWEFRDLFLSSEVIVLMNEGTLKHSLIWKRLFQNIELVPQEKAFSHPDRTLKDPFQEIPKKLFEGKFSASKLQNYMECPRNFYFNYIEKIFPEISIEQDIDPRIAGTIVHEVIETFFNLKKSIEELPQLTKDIFRRYHESNNLSLPEDMYLKRELIMFHRASNGISFIHDLGSRVAEKIDWQFEVPFKIDKPLEMSGRIDCLGVSSNHVFLLDFKSSKASAYTGDAVADLDAIQLWAYAVAAKSIVADYAKKNFVLGYVVLENPQESVLITEDSELAASNKERKFTRFNKLKVPFLQKLSEAETKMETLSLAIKAENVFPARPSDKGTCTFCELNQVCIKSELTNG